MMANRETVIAAILISEGGYSDHPDDPGGATQHGITMKTLAAWRDREVTKEDVRNLSAEESAAIIGRQYADKIMFDSLPMGVDYAMLDTAVNSGPSRAVKIMQQLLGFPDDQVDGIMGEITLAAIGRRTDPLAMIGQYSEARLSFMRSLANWRSFGKGWTSRVAQVRQVASAMVINPTATHDVRALPVEAQAKASGAVKLTSTRSGVAAIGAAVGTVGTALATAGTVATQASGLLSGFADFSAVRYVLLGLAVVASLGAVGVAIQRTQAGATT